jgi:putative glutamine amidotransferase
MALADLFYFRLKGLQELFILPMTKNESPVQAFDNYKQSFLSQKEALKVLSPSDLSGMILQELVPRSVDHRPKILVFANRSYDQVPGMRGLYQQRVERLQQQLGNDFQLFVLPVAALHRFGADQKRSLIRELSREFSAAVALGGADISPEIYHQTPEGARASNHFVDREEVELVRTWIELKEKPIFGICRGLQMIAVALGFQLRQHVDHHGDGHFFEHRVLELPNQWNHYFANFKLPDAREVLSYHHQAVDWWSAPHRHHQLEISEISDDGIVESFRSKDGLIWAVQYHPEFMDNLVGFAFFRNLKKWIRTKNNLKMSCFKTH